MGWRIWGSSTCPLVANRGEKCRVIYVCINFLRAVVTVVVLVVSVIILIYFVVVIFSLRMYAHQEFLALFTGVLNRDIIAYVCRRGVSGGFPPGLRLAFVSSVRDSFGHGKCLLMFYRGLTCMCCVCVCTHTHTHCTWGTPM